MAAVAGGDRPFTWAEAARQRWKRRRLLWRAFRSRHALTSLSLRTAAIRPGDILAFATLRNEAHRLPFWLDHHRALGVRHFLIIDNASDDGSARLLAAQSDVSLWQTAASYRDSRFGMDWINHLLRRHGAGHWCLTLDADEVLTYPHWPDRPLPELTAWLSARGAPALAAMMLDLYPRGPVSQGACLPGQDPSTVLPYFDDGPYLRHHQPRWDVLSIRGGPRQRVFFADRPDLSPHLHKTPLIFWRPGYAYLSSTHVALPRRLNRGFFDTSLPTGVLLHTKFLPGVLDKTREDQTRRQHFTHAQDYAGYYDRILSDPVLWTPQSRRDPDWRHLVDLGLMHPGDWG